MENDKFYICKEVRHSIDKGKKKAIGLLCKPKHKKHSKRINLFIEE